MILHRSVFRFQGLPEAYFQIKSHINGEQEIESIICLICPSGSTFVVTGFLFYPYTHDRSLYSFGNYNLTVTPQCIKWTIRSLKYQINVRGKFFFMFVE